MATAESATVTNTAQNMTDQTRGTSGGRGRNRARGGQPRRPSNAEQASIPNDRGEERLRGANTRGRARGRGGRGGGRGNRDRTSSEPQSTAIPDPTTAKPPPQPGGAASLDGLTKDAAKITSGDKQDAGGDDDAELCWICANPVGHWQLSPCNHRTCTICSLRMRALYKSKACPHCRNECASVIFTDDKEKRYEEFQDGDFVRKDQNLGIMYEKQEILDDTLVLLRYNCPDSTCDVACMGWPDLHRHVRTIHEKLMCDLCTRHKKVFTHEHDLFTKEELRKHEKYGDDNPGAINQSGFKGHPACGFCSGRRFFSEEELYVHCRDKHERCHVCDRRTGGQNQQYYVDYNALEQHFHRDHFPCLDTECLEKKFVVFDSEMDLKAHQLENHPNGLSKDARRDARRVDLAGFDYRPQYQEARRGGGRRGGRGRDPNAEPMPAASGGHMSRAELAHQREREIHTAQSVTSRTFGGQLTQSDPQPQTVQRPANRQSPRPGNAQPALQAQDGQTTVNAPPSPRPAENLTPQEQARRLRHNAVTERAANLLGNDQLKLNEFRERVSAYRNSTINASTLIDAFFSLFDTSSEQLGKLIKELADIFEITEKREGLVKAWADWKAINEDYPTLPGASGASTSGLGSGASGARVMKLKNSTAPSSRSTTGQQRSWGAAAASANNPFPSLPPSTKGKAPPAPTPSWLALRPSAAASTSSAASSAKVSPAPTRSQSSANLSNGEAFPSLPTIAKPVSTVFSPGYSGAGVIRQNTGTAVNAWSGTPIDGSSMTPKPDADGPEVTKGKGRKGKNVVFKWG